MNLSYETSNLLASRMLTPVRAKISCKCRKYRILAESEEVLLLTALALLNLYDPLGICYLV